MFPEIEASGAAQPVAGNKDELFALLGHELRNPLAAIRDALQVFRLCNDSATREWAQGVLERQTQQMSDLIEDLLDFSRVSHGKAPLRKRLIDLAQVVEVAVETVRPCIDERGHVLEVVLPPGAVTLEADPTRLEQVLSNLLANAARYTPPGGRIWLTVERGVDQVVLRVLDNGVGIGKEALPHVFDLFWQSGSGRHSQHGLGIGLALVRHLVEMHGGSVSASSAGPGQGSEFVVRLPRTTSSEQLEGAPFAEKC